MGNGNRRWDDPERGIYQRRVQLKLPTEDVSYLMKLVAEHLAINPKGMPYPVMLRIARKIRHGRDIWAARNTTYVKFSLSKPEAFHLLEMLDNPSDLHQEVLTAYGKALVGQFEKELNGLGYMPDKVDRDPATGDFRRKEF